jgi:hypothetical protein
MRTALPRLTDRLPLGTGGLEVSPICLGLVAEPAIIPAAFEAGINFFFVTADLHWPLYDVVRRGLAQLIRSKPAARDQIVIGVAAYVTQPEFCHAPFTEVIAEIPGLERIDLAIAGGSYGHELPARLPTYRAHRDTHFAGTRAIGASFHDRESARAELSANDLDIAYVRYNTVHPGARTDLFPHVAPLGGGRRTLLYNFKSADGHIFDAETYEALGVGEDYWRPHVTDSYRFVLTEPALDGILCALPTVASIRDLADALAKGPLDDEDHQYMLDLGDLQRGKATVKQP